MDMDESPPPPFETATVARIYMMQGMLDEAEALFLKLLEDNPGDERLETGLADVRQRIQDELEAVSSDCVEVAVRGGKLHCKWTIRDEGRQRAERQLGRDGELVLRLVAFPLHPSRPEEDIPLESNEGKRTIDRPLRAHLVAAAVGLKDSGGNFVSIAHCGAVKL